MVNRIGKLPVLLVLLVLTVAAGFDGIRLVQEKQYNEALAGGNGAGLNRGDDIHRQFARAFELQQQGDFKAAVNAYAAISPDPDSSLQRDIKFNLANLYFAEAKKLREAGDDDLAMPLIELAKQNYREILRIEERHWPAKFNLELALVVAPELDPVDPMDEVNPERSPRAITKMQSREPLP